MPLIIYGLGGLHTQAYIQIGMKAISGNQPVASIVCDNFPHIITTVIPRRHSTH